MASIIDVDPRDREIIKLIAKRATAMNPQYLLSDAIMDLTAAHITNPLRLSDLLEADDFNFAHDVFGINRHLNHDTFKIEDCFIPRFSKHGR